VAVRARVRSTIPTSLPGLGPASLAPVPTPTVQVTRRVAEPGIRHVREAGDQSVAVAPRARRGAGTAEGGATVQTPRQVELFRLEAVDGAKRVGAPIPPDLRAMSLLVLNPLAAPIYFRWSGSAPSVTDYDYACPGEAQMTAHIAGVERISAVVDYAGAVPPGDVNQSAIVSVTEVVLSPSVGPLNA
jgi:hypothetical protein